MQDIIVFRSPILLEVKFPLRNRQVKILDTPLISSETLLLSQRTIDATWFDGLQQANCTRDIERPQLQIIRDNVAREYAEFYNRFRDIGSSVDARGFEEQYKSVWDASENRDYCVNAAHSDLLIDINNFLHNTNIVRDNTIRQYTQNFSNYMVPIRDAFTTFKRECAIATYSVEPIFRSVRVLDQLMSRDFNLYAWNSMASLIAEYQSIANSYVQLGESAVARVQGYFESEFRNEGNFYQHFLDAHKRWDKEDGHQGYVDFESLVQPYAHLLKEIAKYILPSDSHNDTLSRTLQDHVGKIKSLRDGFPNYVYVKESAGFSQDTRLC